MDVKKAILSFISQPYIVNLILSNVFAKSKRFAFQQMEHCLEEIEKYLLEVKQRFKKTHNSLDEEILNLGVSALKEFSVNLTKVLERVQAG